MRRERAESVPAGEVPDVLAPDLRVLFCGINPGRASAAARAHFANPRNDFWRLLHASWLTPRLLAPSEQHLLPSYRLGVTNAARRTTRGSGDLRSADFAGAAGRLEGLARGLRPAWLAFVGKEAYRGAFRERPELGLQERRLADTRLFVLPSTSPANAAVPWEERLRWFDELAGRSSGFPLRRAVRAVVLDPDDRILLVRFDWPPERSVWAPPGGGLEEGEAPEDAIARELAEECGLRDVELGPCLWTRAHWFADMEGWGGQEERVYLVRTGRFEPAPEWTIEQLAAERIAAIRWWTPDELARGGTEFAPRRLPELVLSLLREGPPSEPRDVGV